MLAKSLGVVGLMNTQFAIKGSDIYILEVNPRASRTAPFVSKATGYPLAKIAARNGLSGVSMGMSDDFELAVRFGATHVRVGSALFGSRA